MICFSGVWSEASGELGAVFGMLEPVALVDSNPRG